MKMSSKQNLPDKIFGISTEEAYKLVINEKDNPKNEDKKEGKKPEEDEKNSGIIPNTYLLLEGKTHGPYSYPNILVASERTHLNKTWYQTHKELVKEDSFMLNPRQFVDFLKLLKSGKAFDGSGKLVSKQDLDKILDEIITVRSPYRGEWLDHKYSKSGNDLFVNYHILDNNGRLVDIREPLVQTTLITNKTPGINLEKWVDDSSQQGLPKQNISNGSLYYWQPRENSVAWFVAGADRVDLVCSGGPQGSGGGLGVRQAKIFQKK